MGPGVVRRDGDVQPGRRPVTVRSAARLRDSCDDELDFVDAYAEVLPPVELWRSAGEMWTGRTLVAGTSPAAEWRSVVGDRGTRWKPLLDTGSTPGTSNSPICLSQKGL